MRNKMINICLAICFIFTASSAMAGKKVVLASLDWEPYIGQNLKNQGYVAELVKEAFKRKGYDLEIKYMPWARVIKMAKKGKYDGYFPEYFAEELKTDYKVSSAFPGGPLGFFKRKGDKIKYNSIKDLIPYKIGVVRGYVNTKEFDDAGYLKKEEANDDITNFKKLLKKRLDIVVADKFVGKYVVAKNNPTDLQYIEFIDPPLENKDLYVCISKKTPNAGIIYKAFEEGLKEIIADGTVDKILTKHGF